MEDSSPNNHKSSKRPIQPCGIGQKILLAILISISFFILVVSTRGQLNVIDAVFGSTPKIDGSLSASEWSDATYISYRNTQVLVKQDGSNLYVGFNISDGIPQRHDWAAIFVDVDHDESFVLQSDDILLEIDENETMYEGRASNGNWTLTDVSNWEAMLSLTSSGWQIEFGIPYAKFGITAGTTRTLGVLFANSVGGSIGAYTWPETTDWKVMIKTPFVWGNMTSQLNWVPEFPPLLILSLFITLTLMAAAASKREYSKPH